jgi:hypothetical protein
MIVVIQCAARKEPDAGHLCRRDGQPVLFVADPDATPAGVTDAYARPDDISDTGVSWRAQLLDYNDKSRNNPLDILPAWQLYKNKTYEHLVDKYGLASVYILSAGWGLIAADFLTPAYDITFSPSAEKYKRRRKKDRYDDLRMLPTHTTEPIVFFGGKDYVPLFSSLTENAKGQRFLFYNSVRAPDAPGCTLKTFNTTTRTNWHYECANAFINEEITI